MMRAFAGLAILVYLTFPVRAADVEGSVDHPLVPRYDGSEIVKYQTDAFTDFRLMVAEATQYGGIDKNLDASLPLEGKVTRISYRAPADRAVLEVFRNYENALKDAGFEPIFACDRDSCGGRNFNHTLWSGDLYGLFGDYAAEQRYLAAKLSRPEGDVYAAVYAVKNDAGGGPNRHRVMLQLDVIELQPMEDKMIVLDAATMNTGLAADGRVAVYGIHFDFDKADIKPDSKPQLDEIAALLKKSAEMKVLIVGHTDGKGGFDYNQALSARRAEAVVKALTADYGIDAKRLTPVGAGMAAPVATNRTEEGRAANRRVEIVELF